MQLTFHHTSSFPALYWLDATTAHRAPRGTALWSPKAKAYAIYGDEFGVERQRVHVLRNWLAYEQVTINDWKVIGKAPNFFLHPWVGDDILRILPTIRVKVDGDPTEHVLDRSQIKIVEDYHGKAQLRFSLRARIPGTMLVFEAWLVLYTGIPIVERAYRFVQSDRTTTQMDQTIDQLSIEWGELPIVDHGNAFGLRVIPKPGVKGSWLEILPTPLVMGDATTTDWFRGALLCAPKDIQELFKPENQHWIMAFQARAQGREYGLDLDSTGWLANRVAPDVAQLPPSQNAAQAAMDYQNWVVWSRGPLGIYNPRPWDLLPNAGTTGNQEPFGGTQGTLAMSMKEPRAIRAYLDRVTCGYRPYHYRVEDGSLLDCSTVPVKFWSQHIHWHNGESPYRHGKPHPEPPSNTHGWVGEDNQHRSGLWLHVAYALTGEPWLRAEIEERLDRDLFQRPDGAPRAIGRTFLDMANMAWNLDEVRAKAALREIDTYCDWFDGGRPQEHQQGARPLALVVARYDPIKGLLSVSPWEHGIACLGLCAAYNAASKWHDTALAERLMGYLKDAIATTILIGYQPIGGKLTPQTYIEWDPDKFSEIPTLTGTANLPRGTGGGISAFWYMPAAVLASQITESSPVWDTVQQRAQIILNDTPPQTWDDIEWLALQLDS